MKRSVGLCLLLICGALSRADAQRTADTSVFVKRYHTAPINLDDGPDVVIETPATTPEAAAPTKLPENPATARIQEFATRANLTGKEGIDKKKLVLLAGGLVIAVAFLSSASFKASQ
jgi:hypothetical protein